MEKNEEDWSLPAAQSWESLWECLHDAQILGIDHDRLGRTLKLSVGLGYPGAWHTDLKEVLLVFSSVKHVLVFANLNWTGPEPQHFAGMEAEKWSEVGREFREKSSITTLNIGEFSQQCRHKGAEVMEARWSRTATQVVLELQGYADDIAWYQLLLSGDSLSIVSRRGEMTMEELLAIGSRAWDER